MRLRDDKRVDSTAYFEDEMTIAVLLSSDTKPKEEDKRAANKELQLRREKF